MRCFLVVTDPRGDGIPAPLLRRYEAVPRARGWTYTWQTFPGAAVLTAWDDPWGDPLVARDGSRLAIGMVRLDNRAELERWAGCERAEARGLTDLEVVLRVVGRHGARCVPRMLGDFGFVVWDPADRTVVAATDAFGVKPLYYYDLDDLFAFACRAEILALEERYEIEYLARLISLHGAPRHLSVYAGVRPIPPASLAVLAHGALRIRKYWTANEFEVESRWAKSEHQAIETCRDLLAESIRLRLGEPGETWAQLSGGLDSSSVVSLVQWLAERGETPHGLAGTVTFVDRQGSGADECIYSDLVVARWPVRNEKITNPPSWHDDRHPPPHTDQPTITFQWHPRDRHLCTTVRAAGGRVLLTGWGGDEIFTGNMLFFADWLARGDIKAAVIEMARRAATGRVSFWELAYWNVVVPLLPPSAQRRLLRGQHPVEPWLEHSVVRRYELDHRAPVAAEFAGRVGDKYHHGMAARMSVLALLTIPDVVADSIDVRHPMMYRPLVEFALRLPPDLLVRPHAHRWVLRQAMHGLLPETVRTRVGKQDTGDVLAWSLISQYKRLEAVLRDPILAELGIVDRRALQAAFKQLPATIGSTSSLHSTLHSTLSVEAWLQMRSGRWQREIAGVVAST